MGTQVRCSSDGTLLTLDDSAELGRGGEAVVFRHPTTGGLVAKVYHDGKRSHDRCRKLRVMLADPPADPTAGQGHVSIAWPKDLLLTPAGEVVGFLMARVQGMRPIFDVYHPRTRRDEGLGFNPLYLHRTGRNLAGAMSALHQRGYIIGDVNQSNLLVAPTALVTLVDTDSFQVRDPQGGVLRCPVGTPEFTPPELQGQNFLLLDRGPEHDVFGLGVLLFMLLMEGTHPFSGIYTGGGDPEPKDRIRQGLFPYCRRRKVPCRPAPYFLPFQVLHPRLQELFLRCFDEGHERPRARPGAEEWVRALDETAGDLQMCGANDQHHYGRHLRDCPWCERTQKLRIDPFPTQPLVQVPLPPPSQRGPARRSRAWRIAGWGLAAAAAGLLAVAYVGWQHPRWPRRIRAEAMEVVSRLRGAPPAPGPQTPLPVPAEVGTTSLSAVVGTPMPPLGGQAVPTPRTEANPMHTVRSGETLQTIAAKWLGSPQRWQKLYQMNRSRIPNPNRIEPGQKLLLPKLEVYMVRQGDSLQLIAQRRLGSTGRWQEIMTANRGLISNPDHIEPGQRLLIPLYED